MAPSIYQIEAAFLGLHGKPLTCSDWKSPTTAALTLAATSSSAGASLDIRHASTSRDKAPRPISSILNGRDINGSTRRWWTTERMSAAVRPSLHSVFRASRRGQSRD